MGNKALRDGEAPIQIVPESPAPLTKADRRKHWIVTVADIEVYHTLYGAAFGLPEKCPHCGERIPRDINHCPSCGRR